jgi:hypothetical protein
VLLASNDELKEALKNYGFKFLGGFLARDELSQAAYNGAVHLVVFENMSILDAAKRAAEEPQQGGGAA